MVASPSDVEEERRTLDDVIRAAHHLTRGDLTIQLHRWEDVSPGFDPKGVQARIEGHLQIDQCDVIIGVFWKRFGALDANGQSNTQREIEAALKRRESGEATPEVMVYFCTRPYTPSSAEESEQQTNVLKFKHDLQNRKLLTADYKEPQDFKFDVLVNLMDTIWRLAPRPTLDKQPPTDVVSCTPTTFRSVGWTELVEDLKLEIVADGGEDEQVIISLFANTYITSRITAGNLTEITLTNSNRELSRARLLAATNGIQFDPFPLKAGERQHLVISGVRLDACDVHPGNSATIEVVISHAAKWAKEKLLKLVKHAVTVGHVEDAMTFEVRKLGRRNDGFYALTVHTREKFARTLRTGEEERSTHGTVLKVQFGHAEGFEVFVTSRDIPTGEGAGSNAPARAWAVEVDSCGYPRGPSNTAASPVWPGDIPMIAASYMHAGWEIVAPISNSPVELVFGVLLKGQVPAGGLGLYVGVGIAPMYTTAAAHLPSSKLPVPRFASPAIPANPFVWIE